MSIKCSLFFTAILLFFPQTGFSFDFYAMGCRPTEEPRHEAPKASEEASPEITSQSLQPPKPDGVVDTKTDQYKAGGKKYAGKSEKFKQVAAFKVKKNAENLVRKLRREGYETVIRKSANKGGRKTYRVFVKRDNGMKEGAEVPESSISAVAPRKEQVEVSEGRSSDAWSSDMAVSSEKPARIKESLERTKESSKDVSPSYDREHVISKKPSEGQPAIKEVPLSTAEQKESISGFAEGKPIASVEKPPAEETPVGVLAERPSEDVFGRRGGFVHPFLSVTEYYTDNVFYNNDDKESDFITVLSPGIWLTVPHVHEKLLEIDTSNISPGGYSLKRYEPETFRRYQTYLFYNADIEQFAKHPSENAVNHKAEGLFQYNLKGGLSATVLDQFIASHDDRGTGTSDKLDRFKTNLANLVLTYDVSRRFRLRADYSNFLVNYTAKRNNFRDRDDNSVSGYVFYKIQPKTSLFVEYEYLDIAYKKDIQPDSKEHHYYGGIQWDITAKSRGTVKAGYGVKDFNGSETGNSEDFILEAQIDHKFTPKTSLILRASRQTNETNISGYDFILTDMVELEYLQRLTGKITADIKLSYEKDDYEGAPTVVGQRLVDKYYSGAVAFRYQFKEWLGFDLGYIYMQRDSNDNDFDYDTNVAFLRITGTL